MSLLTKSLWDRDLLLCLRPHRVQLAGIEGGQVQLLLPLGEEADHLVAGLGIRSWFFERFTRF